MVTPEQSKQNLAKPQTHELVQALRLPGNTGAKSAGRICAARSASDDFECGYKDMHELFLVS